MKSVFKQISRMAFVIPALVLGLSFATAVPAMAQDDVECSTDSLGIRSGAKCAKGEGQSTSLFGDGGIFTTIVNIMLFLIGAVAVIMLIIGGIRYVISGGKQEEVTAAKNTILYAVIGIIVAVLAFAIVNFVITGLMPKP